MIDARACIVCQRFGSSLCGIHRKIKNKVEPVNILDAIKENNEGLNACKAHNFGYLRISKSLPLANRYYLCQNCNCALTLANIIVYQKGFKAGGGNPDYVVMINYVK